MAAWDDRLHWTRPTPPAAKHCPYCGAPCKGATCGSHADLAALESSATRNSVHRSVDTVDRPT